MLMLLLGLGPLAAALPGSEDARLPACCRRLGAHHCAMAMRMMMQEADQQPSFNAPATCPNYPGATPAVVMSKHALIAIAAALPALHTSIALHTPSPDHVSHTPGNIHAVRGPPTTRLV